MLLLKMMMMVMVLMMILIELVLRTPLGCLSLGWMDLQYFLNVHCMMQLHNAKEFSHLKILIV